MHVSQLLRLALVIVCAVALFPERAMAQKVDGDGLPYAETESELDDLMWERDRDLLHTGTPLQIQGLEQGDNRIRTGTPALRKTDGKVAMVDTDELRRRKLAMYSEGASFHTPLPSRGSSGGHLGHGDGGRSGGDAANQDAPEERGGVGSLSIGWLFGLIALVLFFVAAWRVRSDIA